MHSWERCKYWMIHTDEVYHGYESLDGYSRPPDKYLRTISPLIKSEYRQISNIRHILVVN